MHSVTVVRLSLFLSLLQCYLIVRLAKSESILIIVLPQSVDKEMSASWERGEEILPGALKVIEEAKSYLNLTVIEAGSGLVTRYNLSYSGNVLEIIANLTQQNRVSDIMGIAGVLYPNVLAVLNKFQRPIASLVHFSKTPINSNDVLYVTASISTLTDSILAFLKEVHPRKIGLITELKQPYLAVSSELSTKSDVPLHHEYLASLSDTVEGIFVSNAHVILLSVSPSTAVQVLCEAYKRGMTWPTYAWILHSYRLDDLLRNSTSNEESCRVQRILKGIFIFQLTEEGSIFNIQHHSFGNSAERNPYSHLLHDSVWALISSLATGSFSNSNEALLPFHSKSDNSMVYVYHNLNSTAGLKLIGIYNGTSHAFTNMSEITFTDHDLPVVNKEAVLVPYLLPLPILCMVFNTILFVLYIVFRSEPSIKSTSVSLSMLMLIGCYFLACYTVSLVVIEPYPLDFCMVHVWLGGIGLSIPLVLATILMKMLRVYRIFTVFKPLKQNGHLSDFALFVYTLLILSPNIILLILWTAFDPRYRVDNFIEHPGYIENKLGCHSSSYESTWFALGITYLLLLSMAVIIVAIKSRNIRLALFKDTKTVNTLIFLLDIVGLSMFIFWRVYVEVGLAALYVGHMLMAFLCQVILFVPKIWPVIRDKVIHQDCKHTRS